MKYIIIENQKVVLQNVKTFLNSIGVSEDDIWPPDDEVFTDWDDTWDRIIEIQQQGLDPKRECCVLFLDISLDKKHENIKEGIESINAYAAVQFSSYVLIALTQHADKILTDDAQVFDCLIKKNALNVGPSEARPRRLKFYIDKGLEKWSERTGRTAESVGLLKATFDDTPALRRAELSLGKSTLHDLASIVSTNSMQRKEIDVRLEALSGGYSGAFLICVVCTDGSATQKVVCKISDQRSVLEAEIGAYQSMAAKYPSLTGCLAHFITTEPQELTGGSFILRQASIPGETLELSLKSDMQNKVLGQKEFLVKYEKFFEKSGEFWRECAQSATLSDVAARMVLTPDDIDRFRVSTEFLGELHKKAWVRGWLPEDWKDLNRRSKELVEKLGPDWEWARFGGDQEQFSIADQHGDFHLRNVMGIDAEFRPLLIDFGRYGLWPTGYDPTRLELQAVLRCMDFVPADDEFGEKIPEWDAVWKVVLLSEWNLEAIEPRFHNIVLFLKRLSEGRQNAFDSLPEGIGKQIASGRLIDLMRIFDAIKICSYQDASVWKRLFFLNIATSLSERLT